MRQPRIIAIGDAVCDKYLSRGKMYPGGQCINTCAYAHMNNAESAFLGKFGNDEVAECIQAALKNMNVDFSHSRNYEGENGFACVTLNQGDRVFIGSNHGGVAKEYPYDFTQEDFSYIRKFDLIYTNLNAYIDDDIEEIASLGLPVAFDFSNRWTDEYLKKICPHIKVAMLSCAHLSDKEREREMSKVNELGVPLVLGTIGEDGSYILYHGEMMYEKAVKAESIMDTMGAGDSYFATFLTYILRHKEPEFFKEESKDDESVKELLKKAMQAGAEFASKICGVEGAFGYGTPIAGRIIDNRNN